MGMGKRGVRFLEDGSEWRLPVLLYADDLVLCDESKEDFRVMVGCLFEVRRRRGLKISAGKSKVRVLNGEQVLECEVHVYGSRLEHVSEFKYFVCVLDESGSRKVPSGRGVAGAIRLLINARDLQIKCARVLLETLLVPVLMYGSETMLWKEKEISRIRAVQMNNLRGLLGIRRIDRVRNARIREFCGVTNGVHEMIVEGVLWWFGHQERMDNSRFGNRIYVGECAGSRSVGRLRKR